MANINTLVKDIAQVLKAGRTGTGASISDEALASLGAALALKVQRSLQRRTSKRPPKTLFMSELGHKCARKLWYEVHKDDLDKDFMREEFNYNTLLKFLYGDIVEEIVLFLCKVSGHEVTDEQKLVEIKLPRGWVLRGKMDAKIDGVIVDVKSASAQSFKKFKNGLNEFNDDLGYLNQLFAYNYADEVPVGAGTAFLAMDKQNGNIVLDVHKVPAMANIDEKEIITLEKNEPPERGYAERDFTGGNKELGVVCSYCVWKYECWKDSNNGKGLRTFLYSDKPRFLVKVTTVPKVPEADAQIQK